MLDAPPKIPQKRNVSLKLEKITQCIRDQHWTFEDFIDAWCQEETIFLDKGTRTLYRAPAQRQTSLINALQAPGPTRVIANDIVPPAPEHTMSTEIHNLIHSSPLFGKFSQIPKPSSSDFPQASTDIRTHAPEWYAFISAMLQNQREHRGNYNQHNKATPEDKLAADRLLSLQRRVFAVTAIVCHSQQRHNANMFQVLLSRSLLDSGVKTRVVSRLAGFGLCHEYSKAYRTTTRR